MLVSGVRSSWETVLTKASLACVELLQPAHRLALLLEGLHLHEGGDQVVGEALADRELALTARCGARSTASRIQPISWWPTATGTAAMARAPRSRDDLVGSVRFEAARRP